MNYTQFIVYMGLYTDEFMDLQDYHKLQVTFTPAFILAHHWRWINRDLNDEPMRSKASTLDYPALYYIHNILVDNISGCRDSMGVVSTRDLFYLYSMR